MIKELISDMANDRIILSQALTNTKIIESEINDYDLKRWIKNEIEGYENINDLPQYRVAQFPFRAKTFIGKELDIMFENDNYNSVIKIFYFIHSIKSYEEIIEKCKGKNNFIEYVIDDNPQSFFSKFNMPIYRYDIKYLYHKVPTDAIKNVISKTKNELLEILIKLANKFPNLGSSYMKKENQEKAQQIINNNILGGNNQVGGFGDNQNQQMTINNQVDNQKISEFLTLLKTELEKEKANLPIEAVEDVLSEIAYAEKQLTKNRDVKSQLKAIGGFIGNVGTNVLANVIASPIFEVMKPFLGL
jgi:hypothetical protein